MKLLSKVILLLCLSLAAVWAGEPLNYNGYLSDTSNITDFRADSLKYSKTFLLSQYENSKFRVVFNDTTAAGFANDSVKFYYFVQLGAPVLNGSNKLDTSWNNNPIVIDTVDMLTSGNFATQYSYLGSDNTFTEVMKVIDTTYVTGLACNTHTFTIPWDVFVRVGIKGLTGNNKDAFLKLRIDRVARIGIKTN